VSSRQPLTDDATGCVMIVHSYDNRRDWSAADVVAITRMHVHGEMPPYCPGCGAAFILPYGREADPPVLGYIHAPGCRWLAAAPPPVRELP